MKGGAETGAVSRLLADMEGAGTGAVSRLLADMDIGAISRMDAGTDSRGIGTIPLGGVAGAVTLPDTGAVSRFGE